MIIIQQIITNYQTRNYTGVIASTPSTRCDCKYTGVIASTPSGWCDCKYTGVIAITPNSLLHCNIYIEYILYIYVLFVFKYPIYIRNKIVIMNSLIIQL